MLTIKNLKINSYSILLPMAGFTDLPFRLTARKFGCKFAFTEMVDATAIKYKNRQTLEMLKTNKADKPLGVQLVGNEEYDFLLAAQLLQDQGISWIDINAACPVRKVVSKHAGAYLMKDPKKLKQILNLLSQNLKIPLSVKIRSGFSKKEINAPEIAKLCEDCGVDAIIIHGRSRDQGYKGFVDYGTIAQVKRAVKIPVIASGDILSAELAKKMFEETGCDMVGVARGALGNPWIFKEIDAGLKNTGVRPYAPTPQEEIIKTLLQHVRESIELYGEHRSMAKMRKVICSYVKDFRGAKQMRIKINQTKTFQELKEMVGAYCNTPLHN